MRARFLVPVAILIVLLGSNVSGEAEFVYPEGAEYAINQGDKMIVNYWSNYTNSSNIEIWIWHNGGYIRNFDGLITDLNGTGTWTMPSWFTKNLSYGNYELHLNVRDGEGFGKLRFEVRYNQSLAQDRGEDMISGNAQNENSRWDWTSTVLWAIFYIMLISFAMSWAWFYKEKWDRTHSKSITATAIEKISAFISVGRMRGHHYDRANPSQSTESYRRRLRSERRERKFLTKKAMMISRELTDVAMKRERALAEEKRIMQELLERGGGKDPHVDLLYKGEKSVLDKIGDRPIRFTIEVSNPTPKLERSIGRLLKRSGKLNG